MLIVWHTHPFPLKSTLNTRWRSSYVSNVTPNWGEDRKTRAKTDIETTYQQRGIQIALVKPCLFLLYTFLIVGIPFKGTFCRRITQSFWVKRFCDNQKNVSVGGSTVIRCYQSTSEFFSNYPITARLHRASWNGGKCSNVPDKWANAHQPVRTYWIIQADLTNCPLNKMLKQTDLRLLSKTLCLLPLSILFLYSQWPRDRFVDPLWLLPTHQQTHE